MSKQNVTTQVKVVITNKYGEVLEIFRVTNTVNVETSADTVITAQNKLGRLIRSQIEDKFNTETI